MFPESINTAIETLSDLPGIGKRSAERLVFGLLKNPENNLAQKLGQTISDLGHVQHCKICGNFCEAGQDTCAVCQDTRRNKRVLCIVESPLDISAIERIHEFRGQYHVLHGVISPLRKITPDDINIASLFERDLSETEEIIFATNNTTESEATMLYVSQHLKPKFSGKITRLARGIPSGGDLDYLDSGTVSRAFLDRSELH